MLRNVIRLAVLLLFAHALYRAVPVYVHYHQFKDAVAETALFSAARPDEELVDRVMELAESYAIPIEREAVEVTRDKDRTYITISYEEQIEWLPRYVRPMPFHVEAEGLHERPKMGLESLK